MIRIKRLPNLLILVYLLVGACSKELDSMPPKIQQSTGATMSTESAKDNAASPLANPPKSSEGELGSMVFKGFCDASAAVSIGSGKFVVAGDEDNELRVYQPAVSQSPIYVVDLNDFLRIKGKEADIEGATQVDNIIYWITSHGANKNGKVRLSRRQLFATKVTAVGDQVSIIPFGKPYTDLVDDLTHAVYLKGDQLDIAATKAPKEKGALNIEGLAATPQGGLLIAFRNPILKGHALVVPLSNPQEVVQGRAKAQLGRPALLDLGGLGIRSMEYSSAYAQYFIVAGAYGEQDEDNENEAFKLYRWSGDGQDQPVLVTKSQFVGLQPEALFFPSDQVDQVQVLSDDGTKLIGNRPCKALSSYEQKFRSMILSP